MQVLKKRFEYQGHQVEVITTRAHDAWCWRYEIDGEPAFSSDAKAVPGHQSEAAALMEATADARHRLDGMA